MMMTQCPVDGIQWLDSRLPEVGMRGVMGRTGSFRVLISADGDRRPRDGACGLRVDTKHARNGAEPDAAMERIPPAARRQVVCADQCVFLRSPARRHRCGRTGRSRRRSGHVRGHSAGSGGARRFACSNHVTQRRARHDRMRSLARPWSSGAGRDWWAGTSARCRPDLYVRRAAGHLPFCEWPPVDHRSWRRTPAASSRGKKAAAQEAEASAASRLIQQSAFQRVMRARASLCVAAVAYLHSSEHERPVVRGASCATFARTSS